MRQNPFSLYDFLGYVFPGALTLVLIAFFEQQNEITSIKSTFVDGMRFLKGQNDNGTLNIVEETVIVTIISYVTGHVVAFLSSITVEKFAIWTYGYPSRFLMEKLPRWQYWRVRTQENSSNVVENPNSWTERIKLGWDIVVRWGHLIIEVCWRLIIGCFLFPISLCTILLGKFLGMKSFFVKPLDGTLKNAIETNIIKLSTSLDISRNERDDFHRVIYHYEYERQPAHAVKMDNYVALYGFLRAMTFIADVSTVWIFIQYIRPSISLSSPIDWHLLLILVFSIGLTYTFFMAFMKFYRRFTLESFMCLITDNSFKEIPQVPFHYTFSVPNSAPNTPMTLQSDNQENISTTDTTNSYNE